MIAPRMAWSSLLVLATLVWCAVTPPHAQGQAPRVVLTAHLLRYESQWLNLNGGDSYEDVSARRRTFNPLPGFELGGMFHEYLGAGVAADVVWSRFHSSHSYDDVEGSTSLSWSLAPYVDVYLGRARGLRPRFFVGLEAGAGGWRVRDQVDYDFSSYAGHGNYGLIDGRIGLRGFVHERISIDPLITVGSRFGSLPNRFDESFESIAVVTVSVGLTAWLGGSSVVPPVEPNVPRGTPEPERAPTSQSTPRVRATATAGNVDLELTGTPADSPQHMQLRVVRPADGAAWQDCGVALMGTAGVHRPTTTHAAPEPGAAEADPNADSGNLVAQVDLATLEEWLGQPAPLVFVCEEPVLQLSVDDVRTLRSQVAAQRSMARQLREVRLGAPATADPLAAPTSNEDDESASASETQGTAPAADSATTTPTAREEPEGARTAPSAAP